MSCELQSAADHPLVEAIQPAQPTSAIQVNIGGVDDLFDRRVPTKTHIFVTDVEYAEPAGGDDANLDMARIDLDQIDAILFASS